MGTATAVDLKTLAEETDGTYTKHPLVGIETVALGEGTKISKWSNASLGREASTYLTDPQKKHLTDLTNTTAVIGEKSIIFVHPLEGEIITGLEINKQGAEKQTVLLPSQFREAAESAKQKRMDVVFDVVKR